MKEKGEKVMAIKIELADQEEIKEIVTAAILTQLGPEKRDEIIKQTLKMLLETKERPHPNRSYGTIKYTPLEEAFELAARKTANIICMQYFTEGKPARLEVEKIMGEAVQTWLDKSKDKLVESITHQISIALDKIRWTTY